MAVGTRRASNFAYTSQTTARRVVANGTVAGSGVAARPDKRLQWGTQMLLWGDQTLIWRQPNG